MYITLHIIQYNALHMIHITVQELTFTVPLSSTNHLLNMAKAAGPSRADPLTDLIFFTASSSRRLRRNLQ